MLLGIYGLAGSGKDTVADILVKESLFGKKISFADSLKKITSEIFMFDISFCYDVNKKDTVFTLPHGLPSCEHIQKVFVKYFGPTESNKYVHKFASITWPNKTTPRYFLQVLGTDVCRAVNISVWVNMVMSYTTTSIIVPDVRFANELNIIRNSGGIMIKITRPSVTVGTHISEGGLDDAKFDHIVVNDGTLKDLREKVMKIFVKE